MKIVEYSSASEITLDEKSVANFQRASHLWRKRLKMKYPPFRLQFCRKDTYLLEARGVAGFIKIGTQSLEIYPKFLNPFTLGTQWRAAMWRFLTYGQGIDNLTDAQGDFTDEDGIADVLADMFLNSIRGAALRGYPVGYKETRITTPFLAGRLDPKKYSKLFPITGTLPVIATKLSIDTATSRLLRWAGRELGNAVESPKRRKQLQTWDESLVGVEYTFPTVGTIPSQSRQYPHLVHAIEIATMLLEEKSAGYGAGQKKLPGFLWDSDDLFERVSRRLIDESVKILGLHVAKKSNPLALAEDKKIAMTTTPDIDIRHGEKSVLMMDAKYKTLKSKPLNSDFYQVMAAGRVRDTEKVALVYPMPGYGISVKSYYPVGEGNPRVAFTVSIGLASFSTKAGIKDLIRDITQWVSKVIAQKE